MSPVALLKNVSSIVRSRAFLWSSTRTVSVWKAATHSAVPLAYSSVESDGSDAAFEPPIIIMHGLLGSKRNWATLARDIHFRTGRKVVTVDARNHGESPHSPRMDYYVMAGDVAALMAEMEIPEAVLVGHSMGGRAMMMLALQEQPSLVDSLFVVDISPCNRTYPQGQTQLMDFLRALDMVDTDSLPPSLGNARKELDAFLAKTVKNQTIRQFMLTNLVEQGNSLRWRMNLKALILNFEENLAKFPACDVGSSYSGPTYFISGENSDYLLEEDVPKILEIFPAAEFRVVEGAGHWVHHDQPDEFLDTFISLLQTRSQKVTA
ncbi:unnamed protein product [Cyprideis torosa]|uniref:sn-1-specific diacylglycerol lipase ABHD11 n=1 Tax=Cyprideis torosa TaxID=163714 RepID=A0A7R8W077_9CRUS|nr:unnamed protein product [Cyprideis torosa]CAG0879427.1 unnamed protein product [Cyprideis torosa]